jgi:hypothetical protein
MSQMFFMKQSHISSYKNLTFPEEKQSNGIHNNKAYIYEWEIAFWHNHPHLCHLVSGFVCSMSLAKELVHRYDVKIYHYIDDVLIILVPKIYWGAKSLTFYFFGIVDFDSVGVETFVVRFLNPFSRQIIPLS